MTFLKREPRDRNDAGVRLRMDGQGDAWANAHREALGPQFHMQDFDAICGMVAFAENTAERFFLEYVPDNWENKGNVIRRFGIVAMFDRKANDDAAFRSQNTLSTAVYLWTCRTLSAPQPKPARFFYVIGLQEPPWRLVELNTYTGARCGVDVHLDRADWPVVWDRLGLTDLRREIQRWVLSAAA